MSTTGTTRTLLATVAALALGTPAAGPALSAAATTAPVASAPSSSSFCGITWGSLARTTPARYTTGTVTGVRAGRHACFDRVVIDVARVPGTLSYDVRYVGAVHEDGSGRVVPLAGGARLQVVVRAPAYTSAGTPTYQPVTPARLVEATGWSTLRQVAWAGSFEGQSTVGLGVRARLPFRAMVLDGPGSGARLVVDVAHRW